MPDFPLHKPSLSAALKWSALFCMVLDHFSDSVLHKLYFSYWHTARLLLFGWIRTCLL